MREEQPIAYISKNAAEGTGQRRSTEEQGNAVVLFVTLVPSYSYQQLCTTHFDTASSIPH